MFVMVCPCKLRGPVFHAGFSLFFAEPQKQCLALQMSVGHTLVGGGGAAAGTCV